jgi:hypothetical protein
MSRPGIKAAARAIAAATAFGALVAGCSDVYFDRRETVALGGNDALEANAITQTVDPWPPHSNNNNLAFNGERMQRAVECYRKNRVTQPVDLDPTADSAAPSGATAATCQGSMAGGSAPLASGSAPLASSAGSGDSR